MRPRILLLLCMCLASVCGCGGPAAIEPLPSGTLTVFAAASLTDPFTEIAQRFEAEHRGVKVVLNLAASQQLSQQLGQGAPADIFASASTKEMDNAIQARRVAGGSQQTFAHNKLVVIYPRDNPAGLGELQDLANPGLKLVLAAKEVPVGKYGLDFLDKASQDAAFGAAFKDDVLKNVVSYEENVKAVLTKIVLGEGDAGIVYLTDISSGERRQGRSPGHPGCLEHRRHLSYRGGKRRLAAGAGPGFHPAGAFGPGTTDPGQVWFPSGRLVHLEDKDDPGPGQTIRSRIWRAGIGVARRTPCAPLSAVAIRPLRRTPRRRRRRGGGRAVFRGC